MDNVFIIQQEIKLAYATSVLSNKSQHRLFDIHISGEELGWRSKFNQFLPKTWKWKDERERKCVCEIKIQIRAIFGKNISTTKFWCKICHICMLILLLNFESDEGKGGFAAGDTICYSSDVFSFIPKL